MVCVERKTPTDLLNSIKDDRLFCQMQGIRQRSPWAYLVVTGPLVPTVTGLTVAGKQSTGWRWESVQGALLIVQEIGARVLFCADDGDYENTITRICNRRRGAPFVINPIIDAY
jgi:ERCC4-type nuclease